MAQAIADLPCKTGGGGLNNDNGLKASLARGSTSSAPRMAGLHQASCTEGDCNRGRAVRTHGLWVESLSLLLPPKEGAWV